MRASPYDRETRSSQVLFGQIIECDLCEEVRWCTERWQLVACRECQVDFLPRRWLL